jgi:kumamolisin
MRHMPTRDEVVASRGAKAEDLDAVERFAKANGLRVVEKSQAKRSVRLEGTLEQLSKAFEVELRRFDHETGAYRARVSAVHIPAELNGVITAVLGFDNRRIGRSYRRTLARTAIAHAGTTRGILPTQLAKLYNYPAKTDGSGQTVGIFAFNGAIADTGETAPGGYSAAGLRNYFTQVTQTAMPAIQDVVVHGPGNKPGNGSNEADTTGEILLDIETVGSMAPGAKIVVYFTEFTEQGWVDAIHAAVHDDANAPSVISISYGNPETSSDSTNIDQRGSLWTHMAIEQANLAFQDAAMKNITVLCASGDNGSSDGLGNGQAAHVDFPASSPYVTGCGGTRLEISNGRRTGETVWNEDPTQSATGGGVSALFALPSWQQSAKVPTSVNPPHHIGRGVPDVASDGDPATGLRVSDVNGGNVQPVGGTSAAAPAWAALVARMNQGIGAHAGFLNPLLYTAGVSAALHDVTVGDNGRYQARVGWDACTGLGTPDGTKLMTALQQAPHAAPHVAVAPHVAPAGDSRAMVLEERIASLESAIHEFTLATSVKEKNVNS